MSHVATITRADDPLLERFHSGIYWDAFATPHEPLDVWRRALRGELASALVVRLALDGDEIIGGICSERYLRSRCGLVTYMVVAPAARGHHRARLPHGAPRGHRRGRAG